MATKFERKVAVQTMERFFDVVEEETGIKLVGDRRDLKIHSKTDWRYMTKAELELVTETWKEFVVLGKPYITGKLQRYLLSEIRRGEL